MTHSSTYRSVERRRVFRRVLVISLFFCPLSAGAQICLPSDTVESCYAKVDAWFDQQLEPPQDPEQETDIRASIRDAVVSANTGAVDQPANPTTSVTDFNPLLQMAADSGGLSQDEQTLTINVNNFIQLPLPDYQLKIVVRNATLNESIAAALRDAGLEQRITELEDALDDFDDTTMSFSYNPLRNGNSRNPRDYQELLSTAFRSARDRILDGATARVVEASDGYAALADAIDQEWPAGQPAFNESDTTFASIDEVLGAGRGAALMGAAEALRRAMQERRETLREVLNETDFFAFADLIANQPQLFVTAQVNEPDNLVGPRTVSAKLTWEKGWVNVNSFEASRAGCADDDVLVCLARYLDQGRNRSMLERGDRVALSLEYKKIDAYDVALIDDGITLAAERDEMLVGSFSYGRYLRTERLGGGKPRIDLSVEYEKVDDSTLRQDRLVATATFSQKVSNASILSFGLIYANKPEFRGDADKEVSARVGINYKLGRQDE